MDPRHLKRIALQCAAFFTVLVAIAVAAAVLAISAASHARDANAKSVHNGQLISAIQGDRLDNCRTGNSEHVHTVARLNRGLEAEAHSKAEKQLADEIISFFRRHHAENLARHLLASERAQASQSKTFTLGLIDALAPLRDCERFVKAKP